MHVCRSSTQHQLGYFDEAVIFWVFIGRQSIGYADHSFARWFKTHACLTSRHDQDGHHSATNNAAFTGKFDVTTIELSAGRQLQPPMEQLWKQHQRRSNTKQTTHHVCRRSLRTGYLRGLATQDRRRNRCQGCMWRPSSPEVQWQSKRPNNEHRLSVRSFRRSRSRVRPRNLRIYSNKYQHELTLSTRPRHPGHPLQSTLHAIRRA